MNNRQKGITAALSSAFFLGLAPVFGKQAILLGFTPLAVVAVRTTLAALFFFFFLLLFKRSFFYIYPVGLIGCIAAGVTNGIGSILYYSALSRLDASIGQLLYSFYPLFVGLWLIVDRQTLSRVTLLRLSVALPGVYLLISNSTEQIDLVGAALMIGSAALYALHLIINQRVLYEVPAPTVTFYTLLSMAVTVTIAFLCFHPKLPSYSAIWWPLIALAFITFFSRITLFMGVKQLGGIQTSLLGLSELLVTVILAQIWLGERLSPNQWIGALLLALTMLLSAYDAPAANQRKGKGFLHWLHPPKVSNTDLPFQGQ